MNGAIGQGYAKPIQWIASQNPCLHGRFKAFFNGRQKFPRDHAPFGLVFQHQAGLTRLGRVQLKGNGGQYSRRG